jgi:NADH:ubiquinone oxidoreductase subunit 3 (subunit A)
MTDFLFAPLIAFFIYLAVVAVASRLGHLFSAQGHETEFKTATYASGEANDPGQAAPGYRQFFVIALFFAVLHLGVLIIGSSGLSPAAVPYLLGLILALVALILG